MTSLNKSFNILCHVWQPEPVLGEQEGVIGNWRNIGDRSTSGRGVKMGHILLHRSISKFTGSAAIAALPKTGKMHQLDHWSDGTQCLYGWKMCSSVKEKCYQACDWFNSGECSQPGGCEHWLYTMEKSGIPMFYKDPMTLQDGQGGWHRLNCPLRWGRFILLMGFSLFINFPKSSKVWMDDCIISDWSKPDTESVNHICKKGGSRWKEMSRENKQNALSWTNYATDVEIQITQKGI